MTPAPSRRAGLGFALLSALTFSMSGSFARSLIDAGWTPAAAVAVRITVAALLLAIPAIVSLHGRWGLLRNNRAMLAAYGVVAFAGGQLCYFNAVQHISVGVALLLEYMGVVLVVGWQWLRHGHRPRRLTAIGSLIALAGLVLVLDLLSDIRLDPVGVLWGLAAAFGLASYFVLSAKIASDLPPLVVASAGMTTGALTLLALGLIGALPMHATFGTVQMAGRQVSWLVPVVGMSFVAGAVAYVTGIAGARLLGASLSSFVGLTEVVFAVLVAWLLLGELPTLMQLAGGALIVAGVVLVHADEARGAAPITPVAGAYPASD
ncbi:MAG TPA: EamA family transporter [Gemmatimonadaceae bacterium]|jgi:drug/metabolite transporter (DMT)-like permease|nr:EamA family transporter [Gemmatimonadaceae bacterium]